MPVARKCIYCNKTLLTSTYGMIHHITKCSKSPKIAKEILSNKKHKNFCLSKENNIIYNNTGHSIAKNFKI